MLATIALLFMMSNSPNACANETIVGFGQCFTLYECQGGSMGSFDESQCRSMGGHSMLSGGICIEL
jgi:hypothetical protein